VAQSGSVRGDEQTFKSHVEPYRSNAVEMYGRIETFTKRDEMNCIDCRLYRLWRMHAPAPHPPDYDHASRYAVAHRSPGESVFGPNSDHPNQHGIFHRMTSEVPATRGNNEILESAAPVSWQ